MDESFKGADGKHYNLSPLTLGDLRRFTQFAQYKDYQDFQNLKDRLPPDDFATESKRLLTECSRKHLTEDSPEVREAMKTLDGSLYLLFLSIHRNHPTLTYEDLSEVVTLALMPDVAEKLSILSGLANEPPPVTKKRAR